ncbi:hypothetical protein CKO12_05775 [Chromatium okenii]|uniref:GtrA family protein n=1 Tax=Chromatium okenii TaxID=61644 RepID=UPI001903229E|nr:GtrA family protein [Chromatium okenii]MBK1641391.1 hypothetical protein [Chromatium okenii]
MSLRVKLSFLDLSVTRFVIVGVANTFVGLMLIYLGKFFFNLSDVKANALGYFCGLIIGFILNKQWSFRFSGSNISALARFFVVVFIAYTFNLITTLIMIDIFFINSYLAQAVGILPYAIVSYLGSRYYVFPENPDI